MRCAAYISFTENVEVVLNALFILISFTENVEVVLNALFILISEMMKSTVLKLSMSVMEECHAHTEHCTA